MQATTSRTSRQDITVSLRKPHAAQIRLDSESKRYNVACMGRRFGKTSFGVTKSARAMLDGKSVAWFAPTYKLLTEAWREIKHRLGPVIAQKSEHEKRLRLITGGTMDFWTLDDEDPARGRKYHLSIVDEAAMVRNLLDKWNLAIRATLMDYKGEAWFLSTPKGDNDFKELFDRAGTADYPSWASFQLPTLANPFIDPLEVEEYQRSVPRLVYEQEVLAEFVTFGGNLIKREMILYADPPENLQYSMGVDLAISTKNTADYTAVVVMTIDRGGMGFVVDAQRIKWEFNEVLEFIKRKQAQWNAAIIKIESVQYQAAVVQELIRTTNMPVSAASTDNKDKLTRFRPLQVKYEQRQIRHSPLITDLDVFDAELLSFPDGKKDDFVDAAVYAYNGLFEINNRPVTGRKKVFGEGNFGVSVRG